MHLPHIVASIPIFAARNLACVRHNIGLKKLSRSFVTSHSSPDAAFAGQAFTHTIQELHFARFIDSDTVRGALVSIEEILIADPYSSVTSKAHFPIQPIHQEVH